MLLIKYFNYKEFSKITINKYGKQTIDEFSPLPKIYKNVV